MANYWFCTKIGCGTLFGGADQRGEQTDDVCPECGSKGTVTDIKRIVMKSLGKRSETSHQEVYCECEVSHTCMIDGRYLCYYCMRWLGPVAAQKNWAAQYEYCQQTTTSPDVKGNIKSSTKTCPECKGARYVEWEFSRELHICYSCQGTGVVQLITYDEIASELKRARSKFPSPNANFTALVEEVGEVAKALLSESKEKVREESIQVATMAIRVAEEGDATLDAYRKQAGLD